MAIAFVVNHPAVTAAIIGPRTREQLESQLPAADLKLPDDVEVEHCWRYALTACEKSDIK